MKKLSLFYILILVSLHFLSVVKAHELIENSKSQVTYLGNEGLLIAEEHHKILFDPFFSNNFDIYQNVPEHVQKAMLSGKKPFDGITVILISHAHGDHFSAEQVLNYLKAHKTVVVIAPEQAITQLNQLKPDKSVSSRLYTVASVYGAPAQQTMINGLQIESVRIAHAGWPGRAELQNIVYRVSLGKSTTVMHLGDADPNYSHFTPYSDFWNNKQTDLAFPPYWFYLNRTGVKIIEELINTKKSIGIHVPTRVPNELKQTGYEYFSIPGESRIIKESKHEHSN